MSQVFLSYNEDDAAYAQRVRTAFASAFGEATIADAVDEADVVLVFIGPGWRADDRVNEIAQAFDRDLIVIPVIVGGATIPREDELPEPLRQLAHRVALEIPEPASEFDVGPVVDQLGPVIVGPPPVARNGGGGQRAEPPAAGESVAVTPAPVRGPSDMLREAALAGVVPGSTVAPVPPPPAASIPPPMEPPRRAPPELEAARGPSPLRLVLPLAVLGVGFVVVAKWLLGWFVTDAEVPAAADEVVCTVFAPPSAAPGDSLLVQAFAHLPEDADDARAIAAELDTDAQRRMFQSLSTRVPRESTLQFELRLPGLEIDDPVASLVWRGRPESVQFGVQVPAEAKDGNVIGTLDVSLDSAPVGHIKFKLEIGRAAAHDASEPQGDSARRYTVAFISYASADRAKVLARVQMLSIAGVRYFQDVLSMEPGDRWERKLEVGIDECDVFLLFWSNNAKRSEWVRKEVAYALARTGGNELAPPEIRPVILEGPPIVKPWEELAHLHFNDRLMYFMRPPGET